MYALGSSAVACGAAGEFLSDAVRAKADVFLTGEMRFHDYLAARAAGLALVLPGHYATERGGVEDLAERLRHDTARSRAGGRKKLGVDALMLEHVLPDHAGGEALDCRADAGRRRAVDGVHIGVEILQEGVDAGGERHRDAHHVRDGFGFHLEQPRTRRRCA